MLVYVLNVASMFHLHAPALSNVFVTFSCENNNGMFSARAALRFLANILRVFFQCGVFLCFSYFYGSLLVV